jgi:hypothetical protein
VPTSIPGANASDKRARLAGRDHAVRSTLAPRDASVTQ